MPLNAGKSDEARAKNIKELIDAGYPEKQAIAIAYAKQREAGDENESARTYDVNGWAEVKDNPISKVGVFPYSGAQISPELEPDRIYNVYRPAEELSNADTIASFQLLPWTDEHAMLGSIEGTTAPEVKGIHGTIGQDVYFDEESGYLKANLKIWSNKMADLIDSGKKELSIGYRCLYDPSPGVYNNESYDFVQRNIRGNHIALVEEGRSGHDVAVLDHQFNFTCDTRLIMADKDNDEVKNNEVAGDENGEAETMSLEDVTKALKNILGIMKSKGLMDEGEKKTEDEEVDRSDYVNKAEVTDEDEKKDDGDNSKQEGMDKKLNNIALDVKNLPKAMLVEFNRRNAIAEKLSHHIGAFDHAEKTLDEVVVYGAKKLGLNCKPGHEEAALEGFFAAARSNVRSTHAADNAIKSGCVDSYLKGE